MAEKFSARLRRRGERIWRAIDGHPFLQQLHAGTLPMNRFTYFILQDYVYLLDFAQVLCHAGSKSPNLETPESCARHALGAVEVERSFHESCGRSLGLSPKRLDGAAKGRITQAYVGQRQSVPGTGTSAEIAVFEFRPATDPLFNSSPKQGEDEHKQPIFFPPCLGRGEGWGL